MIFKYRGKSLEISDNLVGEYKYYKGLDLAEPICDGYIAVRYRISNESVQELLVGKSDEDLIDLIEYYMKREIGLRVGPSYPVKIREGF